MTIGFTEQSWDVVNITLPNNMIQFYSWLGTTNVSLWSSDGKLVQCHQSILAQYNEEFRDIFQRIKQIDDKYHIVLADIVLDDLEKVLQNIYQNIKLLDYVVERQEVSTNDQESNSADHSEHQEEKNIERGGKVISNETNVKRLYTEEDVNEELQKIIRTKKSYYVKGVKDGRIYKCHLCSYESNSFKMKCHVKSEHLGVLELGCKICGFVSTSLQMRRFHMEKHRKMVYCNDCDFKTPIPGTLKKHKIVHEDPSLRPRYKCDICDKCFSCKRTLEDHKIIHTEDAMECCGKKYTNQHYQEHLKNVHCEKMFQCKECDYSTKTKQGLMAHSRNVHEANPMQFRCAACDYSAKSKLLLENHQDSKHNNVEYKCDNCEYVGKSKLNLNQHDYLKHKTILKCNECSYTCTRKDLLKTHSDIEHKNIRYPCDQCPYQALRKFHLSSHLKKVH